jgi:hypothetical protein
MSAAHARSRMLVGLAAAAGAFGAAAMMSAAAAPVAHADAITDIVNAVEGDYADGQTAFGAALSEFEINAFPTGLAALFDGVDDDSLAVTNNIAVGTVEALTNETQAGSLGPIIFDVPTSFADASSQAQTIFADGEGFLTDASTFFAAGEYGSAAYEDLTALDYLTVYPLQELLLGVAASF